MVLGATKIPPPAAQISGDDKGLADAYWYDFWQSMQIDLESAGGSLTAIEGDITTIQGDITTIQGDITTINGEITTIQGDITTINGEITTINSEITELQQDVVSVLDYGAVGNGTTDDTTAIQNAINANYGKRLYLGDASKEYKITSTLTIGDGSSSAISTKQPIYLYGSVGGVGSGLFSTPRGGPRIKWGGTTSTANVMMKLLGPLHNITLENFILDCDSKAGIGLQTLSAYGCIFRNVTAVLWTLKGITIEAVDAVVSGFTQGAMDNLLMNCNAWQPAATSASVGLHLKWGSANNIGCSRNRILGGTFMCPGDANTYGIWFEGADNNWLTGIFTPFSGVATSGNGVHYDGSGCVENMILGGAIAGGTKVSNSPGVNWQLGLNQSDGFPLPSDASKVVVIDGLGMAKNLFGTTFMWSGGNKNATPLAAPGGYPPAGLSDADGNCQLIVPVACEILRWNVQLPISPGVGNTRTFKLNINGSLNAASAITYSGTPDNGTKTVTFSSRPQLVANSSLFVDSAATGAPAASNGTWSILFRSMGTVY